MVFQLQSCLYYLLFDSFCSVTVISLKLFFLNVILIVTSWFLVLMSTASIISEEVFGLGSALKNPSAWYDRMYIAKKG